MEDKCELLSLDAGQLEAFVQEELGERAFRARQLAQWLARGEDFAGMTNLPAALRERLAQVAVANPVRIRACFHSGKASNSESKQGKASGANARAASSPAGEEDARKYLYELRDGNLIEGVLMHYRYGDTLCVSTQVGCRMGCAFCASTLEGRVRNLSAGEILGQVVAVNRALREECASAAPQASAGAQAQRRVHNIVLMGSGEPLDNYDHVVRFLRLVNAPGGLNVSLRNISLSTCGLVERMDRFTREELPVTLSLSLHAPNDAIRRKLMPVAQAYSCDAVLAALRRYVEHTGRRAVIEYALVKGVNCELAHADELAARLRGMRVHVNLIPLNAVRESKLTPPPKRESQAFLQRLEQRGISVTMRRALGADIDGACGQLRRRYLEKET